MGAGEEKSSVTPSFFWLNDLRVCWCLKCYGLQVQIVGLTIVYSNFSCMTAISVHSICTITWANVNQFGSNKVHSLPVYILHQWHMITRQSSGLIARFGNKSVEVRKIFTTILNHLFVKN